MNKSAEECLEVIWDALACFREDCIPEGDETYDSEWATICEAMDAIRDHMGLPEEVQADKGHD